MRQISYAGAICEALRQKMEQDSCVFVIGQGVKNPWYVGETMRGIDRQFGPSRVIDPPVSEQGINGVALGTALVGMRPVVVHPRIDFLLTGVEQIINQAANWAYMFGGKASVPLTIRAIINRGGEQAAQHSQALQAMFMHIPGLKVVMPATPYDAKGLLMASIDDSNPVVYIDDRWLYDEIGDVPEEPYTVPIGKGVVRREGDDVTVVASSYMVREAAEAALTLEHEGTSVELIDLRSLKPLDEELIFQSVRKTGRLVIADGGWKTCGAAAEIAALAAENLFDYLKAPTLRVTLPDCPAPASRVLEEIYYVHAQEIAAAIKRVLDPRDVSVRK